MRRLGLTALLTLALVPVSAAALPNQSKHFVHQPTGYVVKMRTEGETIHIKAKHPVTGRSFKVAVLPGGLVVGRIADKPFEMPLAEMVERVDASRTAVAYANAAN